MKTLFLSACRALQLVGLAVGLGWALLVYGAAETTELFRFLVILLAPLALSLIVGRRTDAPPSVGDLILRAWGVFLLLQVFLAPTLEARGYVLFALGWIGLWSAKELSATADGMRGLWLALILIGLLEGLTGLAQVVNPAPEAGSRIATGTLFNQNHFAGLQNMLFCLAVGLLFALHERSGGTRSSGSEKLAQAWIGALACSLIGIPVFLSRSRAGSLILVLCLVLAFGLVLLGRRHARRPAGVVPLVFVLSLTFGLGALLGLDALWRRLEAAEGGLLSRLEILGDTLRLITDHPLWGVGPMNFEWRFRPYQGAAGRVWWDYAHNDYLQILAEWGVLLGLALWAFVFWRFMRSVRLFWELNDPWRKGAALGCSLAIFSILLHSLVDFNLYIPANHVIFCAILGLSWSLSSDEGTT